MKINRAIDDLLWEIPRMIRRQGRLEREFPVPGQLATVEEWRKKNRFWMRLTEVRPEHHGEYPVENHLFPHPTLQVAEWAERNYSISPAFVAEIPFARVIGRHGAVLTRDHVLLRDVSREFFIPPTDHPLLHEKELPKVRHLKGRYAVISGPGNSTFHWLYDSLPRLEILRLAGYRLDDFDGFFMTRPKYDAHYETLSLLGIPCEKIIWCTKKHHVECDRLVVPSFANDNLEHHPFVYPFLRQLLKPVALPSKKRLYISRSDAVTVRRGVLNEAEVFAVLEKYGFERVTLGNLTFQQQAQLFASAEFIVTPHGGGLANLCFCEKPFQLLELFAPDYVPMHFRGIARQLGFDYEALVGTGDSEAGVLQNGGNMTIDVARLEALLRKMLPNG